MIRALPCSGHPPLGGRLAAGVVVAALVAAGTLAPTGIARGANPNATPPPAGPTLGPTLNPGQAKKAATPPPVVTPAPPPAPVVTTGPIPTAPPIATPSPTAVPVATSVTSTPLHAAPIGPPATPKPRPASGGPGTSGTGTGGGGVARPTPTGVPTPASPAAAGMSSTPESSADTSAAGPTASAGSGSGDVPPVEAFLLIAIVGVLVIIGGWFIAGRRSSRDEEASVAVPGGGTSARARDPATVPMRPAPGTGSPGARIEDPLVAAMMRTRDLRGPARRVRPVVPGRAGDEPMALTGPTWVRRLDPEIRVIPGLRIEEERTDRIRKSEDNRETPEAAARAS